MERMINVQEKQEKQQNEAIHEIEDFDELDLKDNLMRGIIGYGFDKPSPIQQKSILPIINGHDMIAQAPSGTGKTGSFSIGTLQVIDEKINKVQAILISPTKELASQINLVISSIGTRMNVKTCLAIGGIPKHENLKELKQSHIMVGTPGRISDLLRNYDTGYIRILIMDEADQLLKKDFIEQIKKILSLIPQNVQICLYSATMPQDILQITEYFLEDPVKILVEPEKLTLDGIKQYYVDVNKEHWKLGTLMELYKSLRISQSIIFVNSIDRCNYLYDKLTENNHTVSIIHGQLSSDERVEVMKQFRLGTCRILLATNILARGIDVQHVNMVINYDIPTDLESYLHRIGRSGRYGRKGTAINFVTDRSRKQLNDIMKHYGIEIDELPSDLPNI